MKILQAFTNKWSVIALILIIVLLLCVSIGLILYIDHLYARSMTVISLDYVHDLVTIEDSNGFLWSFYGCEDWMVGDSCACVMFDSFSRPIFDDKIVKVTFQG